MLAQVVLVFTFLKTILPKKKQNPEISARNKYFRKVQTFFSQMRLWQIEEKYDRAGSRLVCVPFHDTHATW